MRGLRSERGLLAAAILTVAALTPFARTERRTDFLAFVAFVAVSELFSVRLNRNVTHALGLAPGLGYALLGHPLPEVVACYASGALLAALVRLALKRPAQTTEVARRIVEIAGAGGAYLAVRAFDLPPTFGPARISAAGFGVALLLILLAGAAIETIPTAAAERIPWRPLFNAALRTTGPLTLSIVSVGALLALTYPALRLWSLPLFLAPLAATEFSFRQFESIRTSYLQTIRALSKVPEMAGYNSEGHSSRVADLSVAVAREMGRSDLSEIEYAALLHDIGRLSLATPAAPQTPAEADRLASVGAAIMEETGYFPRVAQMIRTQYEPYRRRGEDSNRALGAGARIIKVVSAYDDLSRPSGLARRPWDALERLHLGTAYDYDPLVIQALTRVLEKRGEI